MAAAVALLPDRAEDILLIKLYKNDGQTIRYWEAWAWDDDRRVVVHWGTLGHNGETRELHLERNQDSEEIISRESEKPRAEGFQEIPLEAHATVVVQYRTEQWDSSEDPDKPNFVAVVVEDALNDCLGWTGNGHCQGSEIGSGTINVISFAVDPYLAKTAIVPALKQEGLLEGAVIAFRRGEEPYTVLWPEAFAAELLLHLRGT